MLTRRESRNYEKLIGHHEVEALKLLCSLEQLNAREAGRRTDAMRNVRRRLLAHLADCQMLAERAHLAVPRRDWLRRALAEADGVALARVIPVAREELSARRATA